MRNNTIRLMSLIGVIYVGLTFAQDSKIQSTTVVSKTQSGALLLEGFRAHSTIVNVKYPKRSKDTPAVFVLETPNIYRTNIGADFLELTQKWAKDHPNSLVIEIHSYRALPQTGKNYVRISYVWVVDEDENLNIQLVTKGACDARTMLLDEVDEKDILIEKEKYEQFKQKIIEAEKKAKDSNLGVWKTKADVALN